MVSVTSPYFCFGCYYYLVFSSEHLLVEEIIVVRMNDPISLTSNSLRLDHLRPKDQLIEQQYIYYSIVDFMLVVQLMYGVLMLTVTNPNNELLYSTNLT